MFRQTVGPKLKARKPLLIEDPASLADLAARIRVQPRIAMDTEAASFHRYVDRVYLVQVTSDDETALVDPLVVNDLSPLGAVLADPAVEIVFHDADYDLRILHRDFGIRARNIFDTRIAAQLVGEPAVGLSPLLEKHFSVKLNKKLQRADWSRRPLTPDMIRYAADDTHFLPALRDELARELERHGRLDWAQEEFRLLEKIRWTAPVSEADAYLRIKGARKLTGRGLTILKHLHEWREHTAQSLDRAPFRVVGNAVLVAIAGGAPTTINELSALPGVPPSVARRYAVALLEAVRSGLAVPASKLPRPTNRQRPSPDAVYDARLDRLKALRNRRAKEIGLEPGLLCPNGTLQIVARSAPKTAQELSKIEGLRRWQRSVLGKDSILNAIRGPQ